MFFLLGAWDPEMEAIKGIVRKYGFFAYATKNGKVCHPGNAYKADPVELREDDQIILVECEPTNLIGDFPNVVRIDHHRERDPGFNMGPTQYWEASSIGQIHLLLNIRPTQGAMVLAAFDHCFPAAFRNECPGVSPFEVLELKRKEIAKKGRVSEEKVCERISFFRKKIAEAPKILIGPQVVRDLRDHYMGEDYSFDLLTAQVAVAIEGEVALFRDRNCAGEPERISLSGNAAPETISAFLKNWAPTQGLEDNYGSPERGYAGGYALQPS